MPTRRQSLSFAIFCGLLAVSIPATAQQEPEELQDEESAAQDSSHKNEGGPQDEPDIVTTTARAPIPAFYTDRSVDVVDETKLLHRQAHSIAEALSEEPGVYQQSTTRGSDTIFLRGLIGPENLILVDGIRFNQSTYRTGPSQYLATLDPWSIRRLELVRGPGSVLYGSGAMGGVVQFLPLRPPAAGDDGFGGRLIGSYASADHHLGSALDARYRQGAVGVAAGLSYRNHGLLHVGSQGNTDLVMAAEQDGRMLASDYEQVHWRFASQIDLNDRLDLQLNYLGGMVLNAMRTDQLGLGQIRSNSNRDDLVWTRLTAKNLAFTEEASAFVAYHRADETSERYFCNLDRNARNIPTRESLKSCAALDRDRLTNRRNYYDVANTIGAGLNAYSFLPIDLRLSYGVEAYRDHVQSRREDGAAPLFNFADARRGNFSDGSTYLTLGTYAHGEYPLFESAHQALMINGGLRVEYFRAHAPDVSPEIGDVNFANTGLVGTAGAAYFLGTNLNIYANWSQGFRAPNLEETTTQGDTGNFFFVLNPDLGPEKSNTFELGTKLDLPGIARFSGALFTTLITDRITNIDAQFNGQSTVEGKAVQTKINADQAYFYGIEAGLHSANLFGFELFGNIALIDGAVQSDAPNPGFQAGPLHDLFAGDHHWANTRRLPPMQFLTGLTYRPGDIWSATFFIEGAGAQTRLASGDTKDLRICEFQPGVLYGDMGQECPGTPSWTTLNLRGTFHFHDLARLNLAINNILDQRYRHHGSGLLGAGFQAMTTLVIDY